MKTVLMTMAVRDWRGYLCVVYVGEQGDEDDEDDVVSGERASDRGLRRIPHGMLKMLARPARWHEKFEQRAEALEFLVFK